MIRKPSNWESVQEFRDRPKLPLNAYICKVRKAVVQNNSYGNQLCILFDVAEGEYTNFFADEYAGNTNADKKWKGVLRMWLPTDDGSDADENTKRAFKGMVTAFETSNPGYQFDWNEASLSGKMIGIMFRNEEWEFKEKFGWTARPFRAMSIDKVRSGDYTLPKDKPLKTSNSSTFDSNYNSDAFVAVANDEDLPF